MGSSKTKNNSRLRSLQKKSLVLNVSEKKGNDFLLQGTILAVASILVRMIGLVYRIPMMNILGEEGNGAYHIAYQIYNVALILSSYSLPLAVSKMVAAKMVKKEYRNSYKIFRCAMIFALISGGIFAFFVYIFAEPFAKLWGYPQAGLALKILAPTILVVAIVGVFRGYFQGKNTMVPTAFSQVFEQIINAIVSVVAAYFMMKAHSASENIANYGAAGGTLGTLMGAITALIFLVLVYLLYRPTIKKQIRRDKISQKEPLPEIYKLLFITITPIILSQTVYQISGFIDAGLFGQIMRSRGMEINERSSLMGMYSKYTLLIGVPLGISSAMSSSMIPSMVSSKAIKDKKALKKKVHDSVKFNMLIAFPCAVGMTVLAKPIMSMIFSGSSKESAIILQMGACAIIFYALSTVTSAVLQGINRMRIPVTHSAISLVFHCIIVFILLKYTNAGVYALAIGNVIFPLFVCILNWISVGLHLKYNQEIIKTFVIPAVSAGIMGVFVYFIYSGLKMFLSSNTICTLSAIGIGAIIYFLCLMLMKCLSEEEIRNMPLGNKLVLIVKRYHLL